MKEKTFYPWAQKAMKNWLNDNKDRIEVKGQFIKDYYPRGSQVPQGKQTIIFYEEK